MPSSRQFFAEGLDPTGLPCVSTADLLQMIRAGYPVSPFGLLILDEATPDVATYPELARFSWIKPSTGEHKYYNGAAWDFVKGSFSIPDGTITFNKLIGSGTPNVVFSVGADGFTVGFSTVASMISAGSLAWNKLVSLPVNTVLGSSYGGAPTSIPFETILEDGIAFAADGFIPVTKINGTLSGPPSGAAGGDLAGTYPNPILANSGVTQGVYGGVGKIPIISVDSKGRIFLISEANSSIPTAKVYYQESAGNHGNFATSNILQLTHTQYNIGGAMLGLGFNEIELEAGTYEIHVKARFWWSSLGGYSGVNLVLYSVTGTVDIDWVGVTVRDADEVVAVMTTVVTPAVTTKYRLYFESSGTAPQYNGRAVSSTKAERFNEVIIKKLA